MSSILQHTLAAPVRFSGIGIHTGQSVRVTLSPSAVNSGIAFLRTDVAGRDGRVLARGDLVCDTRLGTMIGNAAGVTVSTIEHLMAALNALNIDNVLVTLDGPEVPILDGSCTPFIEAIDRVGVRSQQARRQYIEILAPMAVVEDDKRAALLPADGFEVAFEIDFDDPAIGRQRLDMMIDERAFCEALAPCRTFGFRHEVDALRAAGFARGGSLDNVVVIDEGEILNPDGLRHPEEFVRHKAIDAIGDLYLLGAPIVGRYEGVYAGHRLNNALVRVVMASPRAWRYAGAPQTLARAV